MFKASNFGFKSGSNLCSHKPQNLRMETNSKIKNINKMIQKKRKEQISITETIENALIRTCEKSEKGKANI